MDCTERGSRVNPPKTSQPRPVAWSVLWVGGHGGKIQTDIPCPRLPDQGAVEPKSEPRQSGLKNTVLCCLFVDYSCSNITKFQGQLHFQVFCTIVLCTNSRFLHDVFCFEGLENMIAMGTMEKGARWLLPWVVWDKSLGLRFFTWEHEMIFLERKKIL